MTTAEALAVVRSALEEVTPCGCPKGMKYHALNCGVAPGELQADAALALIEERVEEDTEEWERIAQEHGVVFLLDHLGLDGFGNQVRDLRRRAEKAEAERDDATAALERMRLELLRVDEMVSRYSQSADAVSEDRARWMERCAELEAALEIEREGNPHRVYCPKCQADLPCESCKRYAVALPAAEERVAELEAALREIATWPTKVFPGNVTAYVPNHIYEIARRALECE